MSAASAVTVTGPWAAAHRAQPARGTVTEARRPANGHLTALPLQVALFSYLNPRSLPLRQPAGSAGRPRRRWTRNYSDGCPAVGGNGGPALVAAAAGIISVTDIMYILLNRIHGYGLKKGDIFLQR
jgi:hypothetical protein